MVKIDSFEIRFSRDPPVYRTGENVAGVVTMVSGGPVQTKELFVHIKGEGNNAWLNKTTEQALGFRQTYIDRVIDLTPPKVAQPSTVEVPFAIPLSDEMPSSVEGEWGFIRYTIKAVLEFDLSTESKMFGGHSDTVSHSANFDVIRTFDLRADSNHARPVEAEDDSEFFTCCCIRTGYIQAKVQLKKLGFSIDEPITISAEVENRSRKPIENVSARILQHLQFYGQSEFLQTDEVKVSRILVGGKEWGGVPRRTRQLFPHEQLPVVTQRLLPSQFQAAINVEYTILFEIEPTGPSLELPLVLGTVPVP